MCANNGVLCTPDKFGAAACLYRWLCKFRLGWILRGGKRVTPPRRCRECPAPRSLMMMFITIFAGD